MLEEYRKWEMDYMPIVVKKMQQKYKKRKLEAYKHIRFCGYHHFKANFTALETLIQQYLV